MAALRVNEVKVFATVAGAAWWAFFRQCGPADRVTTLTASIAGELVDVACDSQEHAEWLESHMISRGVPKTALQVIP